MARQYPYEQNLMASARRIAEAAGRTDWALVYQSRSGRPGDPWLEPDICDYLRAEAAQGLDAAVLCPVGFLCDHVEVLYDLDVEAADACRELGIAMARADAVNAHPRFIDALADAVAETHARYRRSVPLTLSSA
jgi:ferrochelatase